MVKILSEDIFEDHIDWKGKRVLRDTFCHYNLIIISSITYMSTEDTKADSAVIVLIKKEILTPQRAVENHYGTRWRMKPNKLYSIISPPLASLY